MLIQLNPWTASFPEQAYPQTGLAEKVAAFTDEHIEAIVAAARYSNPRDAEWLVEYLRGRRDVIVRTYFAKVLPLDGFRVEDGEVRFDDLGARHGLGPTGGLRYAWARYDNEADRRAPMSGASGAALPDAVAAAKTGSYFAVTISDDDERKTHLWLRKESDGVAVVGVRREWR